MDSEFVVFTALLIVSAWVWGRMCEGGMGGRVSFQFDQLGITGIA